MLRRRRQSVASRTDWSEHVFQASASFRKLKIVVSLLIAWLTLAQFFPALLPAVHADVVYVYDTAGRLSQVVGPSGNVVTYTYDSDGNVTLVTNSHPSGVTVDSLSPDSGSGGSSVTILGNGFSTNPSQDTVTFNGIAASISSATSNSINVSVPGSATTGIVSVTSPNGSANGPVFTVN